MFNFFKVKGCSLYPLLKEGKILFCIKIFSFTKIKVDNLILFKDEVEGLMVKRVTKINENGYFVKGENPFSRDSRDFGELKKEKLLYKVIYKY